MGPRATIAQLIEAAHEAISEYMAEGETGNRELALAKTHLEDARMRVARGLSQRQGRFSEADLEA